MGKQFSIYNPKPKYEANIKNGNVNTNDNFIKKNPKNAKKVNFKRIESDKVIASINIDKNYDFDKYNVKYAWEEDNFISEYSKKKETSKLICFHCTKRGNTGKNCSGKAKYIKEKGLFVIYEKCNNKKNIHQGLDFENFKKFYYTARYNDIDLNMKIYQKYYVKCLFLDKKANNYTDCVTIFKNKFKDKKFILTEVIVNKIKSAIMENYNNYTIEEICNSLKNISSDYRIDIFPIKIEITNKNKEKGRVYVIFSQRVFFIIQYSITFFP